MFKEAPEAFKDVEDARTRLRYIEGKGQNSKICKGVRSSVFFMEEARPKNPYNLPESFETEYKPYIITGHKKIGIITDLHLPFHSVEATTAAIEYMQNEQVDALYLNGDILDFYGLSSFEKDPRKRSFAQELESFAEAILSFKAALNCKIYYKMGNHEERYDRYLKMKAHEIIGVPEFNLHQLIKNRAGEDIVIIDDKRVVKFNSLNGIHGHEYKGGISTPVNIARGLYLKGKVSAFQGHNHATSEHSEADMNGNIVTTWSIGCLSELHPAYMPLNKWNHGFAIVELHENGVDYNFRNLRIFKGKVL